MMTTKFMRVYRHLHPEKTEAHPENSTRARIAVAHDVIHWMQRTRQRPDTDDTVTATFIVDLEGTLWIADRRSEHLACAQGRDVLSAGEITFDLGANPVSAISVTNQSLGYCPEPESWPSVAKALEAAGIEAPASFTAEFTFRRCEACNATNVVRDNWFVCAMCGAELKRSWNFAKLARPGSAISRETP